MARARLQRKVARLARSDEFAIAPHQLVAARDPTASIRNLVATQTQDPAVRAYSLWRDDPELARALNDRLRPHTD